MSDADHSGAPTQAAGDDTQPAAGRRFARRYLVERQIGRGGMGTVWAVLDADLGERVALKTLDRSDASAQTVDRFRREVRLARRVTHRNVARIFDIGEAGGLHYLTMELVDGESLSDRLRRAPVGAAEACDLARQIAMGLGAAHGAAIVHRDLKPGNVLVDRDGRAVITDFGIACATSGEVRLTVEGAGFMGTPAYMSPEQVRGGEVDARSDLYALGVMLFEMLTGRLPFEGDSMIAMAVARLHQPPPDPRELASVDDTLAALVLECLAVDPAARPRQASEIVARLPVISTGEAPRPAAPLGEAPTVAPTRPPVTSAATGSGAPDTGQHATSTGARTTRVGEQAVAVLSFRYRGTAGEEYMAEALTDEIIDLLSRNRGLRVSARGATAKFGPDADPRSVGAELGVDVVVDGSVQRSGEQIRIQARLVAVDTGFQLWSDRFDGKLADVFELQDRLATQIAETLRVQLQTAYQRNEVAPEAVALYLRGRSQLRAFHMGGQGPDGAVGLFEQALAIAPNFRPAIAALAIATERSWFSPAVRGEIRWRDRAIAAAQHALAEAPDLPETHVAAARVAMQQANYGDAARAVTRAIALAPTFASAHDVLGALQCEAGRPEEGLRHLRLAVNLDPTLSGARMYQARYHEMHGRPDLADALFDEAEARTGTFDISLVATRARIAAWRGDLDRIAQQRVKLARTEGRTGLFDVLLQAYIGEIPLHDALDHLEKFLHPDFGPRFTTMGLQLTVELAGGRDDEAAERMLTMAADHALVDLDWMDHCPMLGSVRKRPGFAALRERVRLRAETIWLIE